MHTRGSNSVYDTLVVEYVAATIHTSRSYLGRTSQQYSYLVINLPNRIILYQLVCILPGTLGVCIKWHAKISVNRLSVVTVRGGFQQNLENLQEKIFKPNKVLKVGLGEIITCSLSPLNKSKFRTYFLGPLQYVCIHVMSHCLHALNIQHVIVYERSRL